MFHGCENLLFLDIARFNTLLVSNMENMFKNCKNLIYLNVGIFEKSKELILDNIFKNIYPGINICIEENNSSKGIMEYNLNFDCSNGCSRNKTIVSKSGKQCVENCLEEPTLKYEYNNVCMDKTLKGLITFI